LDYGSHADNVADSNQHSAVSIQPKKPDRNGRKVAKELEIQNPFFLGVLRVLCGKWV
jgi:hypothetical protein